MAALETVFIIAMIWIGIIFLSTRIDFEKRGILIAPLLLLWRTDRFQKFYSFFTRGKMKSFWQKYGNLSVLSSLFLFLIVPTVLLANLISGITGNAGLIFTPNPIEIVNFETFLFITIPLIISIFIHDFFYAVMAKNEDVEIEKTGLILVAVFVITFIKLSEENLKKLTKLRRLRIHTSGIFANIMILLMIFPLFLNSDAIISNYYEEPEGVIITAVDPNGSGASFGLQKGLVINEVRIGASTNQLSNIAIHDSNEFIATLRNIPAYQFFTLRTNFGDYSTFGYPADVDSDTFISAYLGITVYDYLPPKHAGWSPFLPYYFVTTMMWFININIVFGIYNLLPLPLSDGRNILDNLSINFSESSKIIIRKIAFAISGILLAGNILLTIF